MKQDQARRTLSVAVGGSTSAGLGLKAVRGDLPFWVICVATALSYNRGCTIAQWLRRSLFGGFTRSCRRGGAPAAPPRVRAPAMRPRRGIPHLPVHAPVLARIEPAAAFTLPVGNYIICQVGKILILGQHRAERWRLGGSVGTLVACCFKNEEDSAFECGRWWSALPSVIIRHSARLRLRLSAVAQQIRACPQILPRKYTGWVLKRDMAKSRAWSACSGVNLA